MSEVKSQQPRPTMQQCDEAEGIKFHVKTPERVHSFITAHSLFPFSILQERRSHDNVILVFVQVKRNLAEKMKS